VTLTEVLLRLWKRAIGEQPHAGNDRRRPTEEQTDRQLDALRALVANVEDLVKEQRGGSKQQHDDNKINRKIAIGVLLVTTLYAGLTLLTWREMRNSTKLAADAVREAGRAASAATTQAQIAASEQRAWAISAIKGKYTFADGQATPVGVDFRNFGKLPALSFETKVTIALFIGYTPTSLPQNIHAMERPPKPYSQQTLSNGLIAPGGVMTLDVEITGTGLGRGVLVIYGRSTYTDSAGTTGESGFCRYYRPDSKEFYFCPKVADWAK
jgi:hypothetical protein